MKKNIQSEHIRFSAHLCAVITEIVNSNLYRTCSKETSHGNVAFIDQLDQCFTYNQTLISMQLNLYVCVCSGLNKYQVWNYEIDNLSMKSY